MVEDNNKVVHQTDGAGDTYCKLWTPGERATSHVRGVTCPKCLEKMGISNSEDEIRRLREVWEQQYVGPGPETVYHYAEPGWFVLCSIGPSPNKVAVGALVTTDRSKVTCPECRRLLEPAAPVVAVESGYVQTVLAVFQEALRDCIVAAKPVGQHMLIPRELWDKLEAVWEEVLVLNGDSQAPKPGGSLSFKEMFDKCRSEEKK